MRGYIFRPLGRAAARDAASEARKFGQLIADGQLKWRVIKGGYILRGHGYAGTVTVTALDTPVVIAFGGYNSFPGGDPTPGITHIEVATRDVAMPSSFSTLPRPTPAVKDVRMAEESDVRWLQYTTYYVTASMPAVHSGYTGGGGASGEYMMATHLMDDSVAINSVDGVYGVWVFFSAGTPRVVRYAVASDVSLPQPTPIIQNQQAYAISDAALSAATGANTHWGYPIMVDVPVTIPPELPMDWWPYADLRSCILPTARTVPPVLNTPPPAFCVAAPVFVHANAPLGVLCGVAAVKITPSPVVETEFTYLTCTPDYIHRYMLGSLGIPALVPTYYDGSPVFPNTGRSHRNMITAIGTVMGETTDQRIIFACTVDAWETQYRGTGDPADRDNYWSWGKVSHYVLLLNANTGAVSTLYSITFAADMASGDHYTLPYTPDVTTIYAYAQCTVSIQGPDPEVPPVMKNYCPYNQMKVKVVSTLWPRVAHTDTDLKVLVEDGTIVTTGLRAAGYSAVAPVYNGYYGVAGNVPNIGYTSPTADNIMFDIGDNKVGVLAINDQSAGTHVIRFVVLDADTLVFIEERGTVGTYAADYTLTATGSCAIRETAETFSSLLVNVNRFADGQQHQYTSTDGGRTWARYLDGVWGTPHYQGNVFHVARDESVL